jgi:CPA2 family monovalent cation:H+ antiporter-2
VFAIGRLLLRPIMVEIARSRLKELFTLTVLLVVLSFAWLTERAGLSLALGGFLAGIALAETEYRHQVEAVIRPFRELLLGLFFISVGMLLDLRLLAEEFLLVSTFLVALTILKVGSAAIAVRGFVDTNFKALRTGIVLGSSGEFGVALLTLMITAGAVSPALSQPLGAPRHACFRPAREASRRSRPILDRSAWLARASARSHARTLGA